jgi:hypothetical protein
MMRQFVRWGVAVVVSAAGFALAWWICEKPIRLDEDVSLGIAGAVLAVLLAVVAWWAPLKSGRGGADSSGRQQAPSGGEEAGGVANTISGGTFSGPVLQGRDFTGLNFGGSQAESASPREDPDVG